MNQEVKILWIYTLSRWAKMARNILFRESLSEHCNQDIENILFYKSLRNHEPKVLRIFSLQILK